jgi:hypothetical protein
MALCGTSKIGGADFLGGEFAEGEEGARGAPYQGN